MPKINHISPSRKPLNSYRESFEVGWRFLRFAINFYFLFQPSWSYLNSARSSREFDLSGTNFTSKWLVIRYQWSYNGPWHSFSWPRKEELIIYNSSSRFFVITKAELIRDWSHFYISMLCSIFSRPSLPLLLCTFSNNRSNVNIHKIDAKQRHFLDKDCERSSRCSSHFFNSIWNVNNLIKGWLSRMNFDRQDFSKANSK